MARAKAKSSGEKTGNGNGSGGYGLPALPADLMSDLQADATDASANVRSFGESNLISTKGGVFSFKGQVLGPEMEAVVLASASLNEYYEGAYDPASKGVTPACYALSETGKGMSPHSAAPDKQATVCDGCPQSEMGSALQGKGRACKQKVRLALLHADDCGTAESVMEAMIVQVSVPSMSVANYGNFVKVLANDARFNKMPTYRFRTKLVLENHPKYMFVMKFIPMGPIDDVDVLRAVMSRVRGEAKELVLAPFPPPAGSEGGDAHRGSDGQWPGPVRKALKKLPTKPVAEKGNRSRFAR